MNPLSHVRRYAAAFCGLLLLGAALTARAQQTGVAASFEQKPKEAIPVNVLVGQSKVISFDRPIGRFSVSNPEVAEAVLISPEQVLVNGKAFGQINFIAWEKDTDSFIVFDVAVRTNLSLIDSQIRVLFPKDDIRLSQANGSVVLSGSVTDARSAAQADAVVQAAGFKTVNMLALPVKDVAQVQLLVRVAEVSRSRGRELGASLASANNGTSVFSNPSGPSQLSQVENGSMFSSFAGSAVNLFLFNSAINTQAFIHALHTQGAIRELAEPNLIAMDGQQASFLAGGEFPVPIVQGGGGDRAAVSILFKEYGVRLVFKPTIIDEDHIRLELEPEVSTIDFANGVRFEGFLIPALKTRRAKTGVELRDGQSFALAGLLDNGEIRSMSKIPGIGDIPIIGNLFKSKSFSRNETELMFIVTAQLVKPVSRDDLPQMRGLDGIKQGSPLGVEPKGEGVDGASGYSIAPKKSEAAPPPAKPEVKTESLPAAQEAKAKP